MKKNILSNVILGTSLVLISSGCTRAAKEDVTQLKLIMPAADAVSLKKRTKLTAMADAPEPSGLTGTEPINCYLVGVGGPEPEMSRNTCENMIGTEIHPVGVWAGAIPEGKEISLTVPSGKNRNVVLYGAHAPDISFCRDFKVHGFPEGELSSLYFLGKATVAEMKAGTTVEVKFPISFDYDNESRCEGPDFPANNGGSIATKIQIEKEHFPRGMGVLNQCVGIDLLFRDDQGRHAELDSPTFIEIHDGGGVPLDIYADHDACINDNMMSDIEVFPGNDRAYLYIKPTTTGPLSLTPVDINNILLATGSSTITIVNDTPTPTGVRMDSPWSILANVCYPVSLSARTFQDGPHSPGTAPTFGVSRISGLSGGLYTTTDCSGSPVTSGTVPMSGSQTYYLKVASGTLDYMLLEFNPISPAGNNMLNNKTQALVRIGSGDTVPKYLWANGPNNGPTYNSCFSSNPYSVEIRNSNGTTIPAPAGGVQFYASVASAFDIFFDSSCSTPITSGTPATIAAGAIGSAVYLKPRWGEFGVLDLRNPANTIKSNPNWLYDIAISGGPYAYIAVNATSLVNVGACFPIDIDASDSGGIASNLAYSPIFNIKASELNVGNGLNLSLYSDGSCATALTAGFTLPTTGSATKTIYGKFTGTISGSTPYEIHFASPLIIYPQDPDGILGGYLTITVDP